MNSRYDQYFEVVENGEKKLRKVSVAGGYPSIRLNGKQVKLHVYIWELVFGRKPKGHDVHHKDGDPNNFYIENLQLLKHGQHIKKHYRMRRNLLAKTLHPKICSRCGKEKGPAEFHRNSSYCKKCKYEYGKEWSARNREKRRISSTNYYRRKLGLPEVPFPKEKKRKRRRA